MPPGIPQFHRGVSVELITPTGAPILVNTPDTAQPLSQRVPQRVDFTVQRSLAPVPGTATIRIFNLTEATARLVTGQIKRIREIAEERAFVDGLVLSAGAAPIPYSTPDIVAAAGGTTTVRLSAGYQGTLAGIFQGQVLRANYERAGGDSWLEIECEDGGINMASALANRAFKPNILGTQGYEVLAYLVKTLGLVPGQGPIAVNNLNLPLEFGGWRPGAFVCQGAAKPAVDEICESVGVEWWIEDGLAWFVSRRGALPGPPVVTYSTEPAVQGTALVKNRPRRIESNQIQIDSFLAPAVKIARSVVVASAEVAGTYRIDRYEHSGSNRSGSFSTSVVLAGDSLL